MANTTREDTFTHVHDDNIDYYCYYCSTNTEKALVQQPSAVLSSVSLSCTWHDNAHDIFRVPPRLTDKYCTTLKQEVSNER